MSSCYMDMTLTELNADIVPFTPVETGDYFDIAAFVLELGYIKDRNELINFFELPLDLLHPASDALPDGPATTRNALDTMEIDSPPANITVGTSTTPTLHQVRTSPAPAPPGRPSHLPPPLVPSLELASYSPAQVRKSSRPKKPRKAATASEKKVDSKSGHFPRTFDGYNYVCKSATEWDPHYMLSRYQPPSYHYPCLGCPENFIRADLLLRHHQLKPTCWIGHQTSLATLATVDFTSFNLTLI